MDTNVVQSARGDIDLLAFCLMVGRHWRVVAIACAVSLLAAIGYLMIATPMFRAEVVVVPPPEDSMSGSGSALRDSIGGLASLAGLDVGQESPEQVTADAVLDSRSLVEEFIRRNDLVGVLLKKYKPKAKTLWRAVNYFKLNLLKVKKDSIKGTTKVTVEWTDPVTAARWANGLVALANEMMRAHARTESSRNVEYLDHQLEGTNDVQLRQDFSDILESETRKLMLANGRSEYAFQVIDPGVAPEVRSRPQTILVLLIGMGLGLGAGCTIAFVRERMAERRREAAAEGEAAAEVLNWRERRIANESAAQLTGKS
ncbi:MAG TPA: Wzz/FepE/Etk N-terminal domain-containing protein [Steroidobacteraceae bacterium]|jgi:uncharacterized protein involved in exopolysaccharide biosynthesis|nr:Wzz/FepE/Etk N-terminal domain-containing protein [Steroidobacteraceae bacterium]